MWIRIQSLNERYKFSTLLYTMIRQKLKKKYKKTYAMIHDSDIDYNVIERDIWMLITSYYTNTIYQTVTPLYGKNNTKITTQDTVSLLNYMAYAVKHITPDARYKISKDITISKPRYYRPFSLSSYLILVSVILLFILCYGYSYSLIGMILLCYWFIITYL